MEEKNKKKRLLYTLIGVIVLLASVGGAYAFFSASISNTGNILGQTQNINNSSLRLSVTKVNFNGIDTNVIPSNDLVPAFFGLNNNDELNVEDPSQLDITNVQDMIQNKCVNTSEGFTGCHVYKIAISADQSIPHANLLLGLTVNDHSTSGVSIKNKSQWGYVVFTASQNSSSTGVVGSGTQTSIADGAITNLALNSARHGAPSAIGDGLVSSPRDNRIDIHNNQKLIGCNSAGLPQEVVYYLLVYVNDTDISQNTSNNGEGDDYYAVGSYSGTLELRALGGKVRANFGPDEATGTLKSRSVSAPINFDINDDGVIDENDAVYRLSPAIFGNDNISSESIINVYTVNHTSVPANAISSWDASEEGNGSVMAWIIDASTNEKYCMVKEFNDRVGYNYAHGYLVTTHDKEYCDANVSYEDQFVCGDNNNDCVASKVYNLYIGQVGGVKTPSNSAYMFAGFVNAEEMDLSNLDTSNATNMSDMFLDCFSLSSLDLSNFSTANVTDMSMMFRNCVGLTSLELSSFNTSNVISMFSMFEDCSSLTEIDISNFNTSNVIAMAYMFSGCESLTEIDLSGLDLSNVTGIFMMFSGSSLTEIDLSGFDPSKIEDGWTAFNHCFSLRTLNLGNLDMSRYPDFIGMSHLETITNARAEDESMLCSLINSSYDSSNNVIINGKLCSNGTLYGNNDDPDPDPDPNPDPGTVMLS